MSLVRERHDRGSVQALAFSPDGGTLASNGLGPGSVVLWDVASRSRLRTLVHPDASTYVNAVAFSAEGKMLATADGYPFIHLGRGRFTGVSEAARKAKERLIFLWDTETGQPLGQPLKGHAAPVTNLAFSPDCAGCSAEPRLVSGDSDGTLLMWDVSVASWQKRACAILNRRLTEEEWERYFTAASTSGVCSAQFSFEALTAPPVAAGRTPQSRRSGSADPRDGDDRPVVLAQQTRRIYLEARPARGPGDGGDARAGDDGGAETNKERLRRVVSEQLGIDGLILPTSRLAENLGAGKLEKAALLIAVGKEFGLSISAEDAEKILTFQDLLAYVERHVDAGEKPK